MSCFQSWRNGLEIFFFSIRIFSLLFLFLLFILGANYKCPLALASLLGSEQRGRIAGRAGVRCVPPQPPCTLPSADPPASSGCRPTSAGFLPLSPRAGAGGGGEAQAGGPQAGTLYIMGNITGSQHSIWTWRSFPAAPEDKARKGKGRSWGLSWGPDTAALSHPPSESLL